MTFIVKNSDFDKCIIIVIVIVTADEAVDCLSQVRSSWRCVSCPPPAGSRFRRTGAWLSAVRLCISTQAELLMKIPKFTHHLHLSLKITQHYIHKHIVYYLVQCRLNGFPVSLGCWLVQHRPAVAQVTWHRAASIRLRWSSVTRARKPQRSVSCSSDRVKLVCRLLTFSMNSWIFRIAGFQVRWASWRIRHSIHSTVRSAGKLPTGATPRWSLTHTRSTRSSDCEATTMEKPFRASWSQTQQVRWSCGLLSCWDIKGHDSSYTQINVGRTVFLIIWLAVSRRPWEAGMDRKLGDVSGHHVADDRLGAAGWRFAFADQNPLRVRPSCCTPGKSQRARWRKARCVCLPHFRSAAVILLIVT